VACDALRGEATQSGPRIESLTEVLGIDIDPLGRMMAEELRRHIRECAKTGKLTVADTYTQQSGGTLGININGATVGTKYDQLAVSQSATLGGALTITLGTGFTPTVGETFTILTASSVSNTFTTVNGLSINSSEHFTVTYNAGSVVLTVVSGPLPASSPASSFLTQVIHPPIHHGSDAKNHFGPEVAGLRFVKLPAVIRPAAMTRLVPVSLPTALWHSGTGVRGFRPMDQLGSSAMSAPLSTGDPGVASSLGVAPVSAAAFNSMSTMNHLRFECGVDLKALLKTSRKQLIKALWAAPDSPDALAIGYMTYNGSR